MSRKENERIDRMIFDSREMTREFNYSQHRKKIEESKDESDMAKDELPPVKLSYEEYRKLCKEEKENYWNMTGRFSLDPKKREEGKEETRNHWIWDLLRFCTLFLALLCTFSEQMEASRIFFVITIVVWIIGGKIAGPMWFNLFQEK